MDKRKSGEVVPLQRWTREEVAAIIGPPMDADPVFLAALTGSTRSQVRAELRRERAGGRPNRQHDDVGGPEEKLTFLPGILIAKVGPKSRNPPKMLRAGRLVDRPSMPAAEVLRRFSNAAVTVAQVMEITGQTPEEVECDLLAGRLWAHRGYQPRWEIWPEQFDEDFHGFTY